jgi:electron transfer flavoprotein beta subunit
MRIAVCIKQVPSTNEVRMDPVTHTIVRDARQSVTNPFDSYAIELAVQLGQKLNAETWGISMGIPATERLLRDACARGLDKAMLLTDRAFAGADTLATAYTLSLGIGYMGGADLVLCGRMAVDGDTAQIGPELAEHLGIPHVTDVCEVIEATPTKLVVRRLIEGGTQRLTVRLPALLTVAKDINQPRMPSIAGVRYGLEAPFVALGAAELGADPAHIGLAGSPTQVVRTYVPERGGEAIALEGDAATLAERLLEIIEEVSGHGRA